MALGWKITPLSNMWYWITIACNICKNDSKFNATVCKLLHNELLRLVLHEKMKNLSLQPHLELFGVENHPFVQYVVLNTIACNICKNDSKFNATVCKPLHNELLRLVWHEKMKNLSLQPHWELFGVENHPFVQYVVLLDNVYFIITNISAVSKPFAYCFLVIFSKNHWKQNYFAWICRSGVIFHPFVLSTCYRVIHNKKFLQYWNSGIFILRINCYEQF